jgi:hypothetical protein
VRARTRCAQPARDPRAHTACRSRVPPAVPRGATILIVQQPWIGLLLDGYKRWEIRGQACRKARGERIFLALSGGGGVILGHVTLAGSHGPLSRAEYVDGAERHCVAGTSLPYGASTHAWEVKDPVRFRAPVPYRHKPGVVVWAKME